MARRKRSYGTRYRTRTVTKYRSRGGGGMFGSLNSIVKPVMGGVVTGIAQGYIPDSALGGFGDVAVPVVVGMVLKDKTLVTIGAYQAGLKLAGNFGGTSSTSSTGGF